MTILMKPLKWWKTSPRLERAEKYPNKSSSQETLIGRALQKISSYGKGIPRRVILEHKSSQTRRGKQVSIPSLTREKPSQSG